MTHEQKRGYRMAYHADSIDEASQLPMWPVVVGVGLIAAGLAVFWVVVMFLVAWWQRYHG